MLDYIIVGSGLAGIAFAEMALQNRKSVLVFDNHSWKSSKVAGGVYNPVILKRFSGLSGAQQQLDEMVLFYDAIQERLGTQFRHEMPLLRKFASVEEQNNWFVASDKPALTPFLSTKLVKRQFPHVVSPFGYGEVLHTGYVDTSAFIAAYQQYLKSNGMLADLRFKYDEVKVAGAISYNGLVARHIVFADGFGIRQNPFFNDLPLAGTKGELLVIKAPGLPEDVLIKSDVFLLPVGNQMFKVGATYEWTDKTETPTSAAREELLGKLEKLIDCPFEIISQDAGIRPTVQDRKALIGTHQDYGNVHLLNGLGTRGVMLAPLMAKLLFNHIESGGPIPDDVNLNRFRV